MMKINSGYLVETKTGKQGRILHSEKPINGKVIVHVDGLDKPMLCDKEKIKVIGFIN